MNVFNRIQLTRPKVSVFDMSYDHKTSLKMGYLVPVHLQECIPGDVFHMSSEAMFRTMPLVSPMMHKVEAFMHYFFCPNRIVWENWEKFITGGQTVGDPVPAFPTLNLNSAPLDYFTASSLPDYLGCPIGVDNSVAYGTSDVVSALPFAMYQRIYQEFYRDQNVTTENLYMCIDGVQSQPNSEMLCKLQKRAWEHDYFTSCLPYAQKGDAVLFPLDMTGTMDVELKLTGGGLAAGTPTIKTLGVTDAPGDLEGKAVTGRLNRQPTDDHVWFDPEGSLEVDAGTLGTTTTINDLRTAFSLQKWLEKNARAGSRYVESLFAHFGVRSSDKRLQRPEYIGGSKSAFAISEVLQTSETATTAQGNMAGHGISVSKGNDFTYRCEEHGFIFGILSIRPKTAYYQGLPKHFYKTLDRTQYFWPDFAHLGEEEVLNMELYVKETDSAYNLSTFGYLPRYSEYRYNAGRVSGQMKTSLEFWQMGRSFDDTAPPVLNDVFIRCTPTKRVFADTDINNDEIVAHIYHRIIAKRPIPKYGNPGSI